MLKPLISYFRKLVDLREGAEDKDVIIENIKDDADFSSARFWTLVFAIGVACVGLNINSIPIIIGAMLISPLMGPIVSVGLALAINDAVLMRRSLRNLFILVTISIGISTLYFALTPITNAQSELLSLTQPTIFDVLVAIFGGIAGFIGISRAKHSNIIPGVAIATALMPPLCTVGYGIGTLQPQFIFGAFYLFLINGIFICLSALLVAKYLKLPKKKYENIAHQHRVRNIIAVIIVTITTPALFFAYSFVQENNFRLNSDHFIQTMFEDQGYVVIYKNITYKSSPRSIELAFLSKRVSEAQLQEFNARLLDFNLPNTTLYIKQGDFSLTEAEWQTVLTKINGDNEIRQALEERLKNERLTSTSPEQLLEEARALDSRIIDIAVGELSYAQSDTTTFTPAIVFMYLDENTTPFTEAEEQIFAQWIQVRVGNEKIVTRFIPAPTGENQEEI
jgi:uncharacterized hydrophobic protein (TIGR00271 family)